MGIIRILVLIPVTLVTSIWVTSWESCRKSLTKYSSRPEITVTSDCEPMVKRQLVQHRDKTAVGNFLIEASTGGEILTGSLIYVYW